MTRTVQRHLGEMLRAVAVIFAVVVASVCAHKNPNYANGRTTMVHLFEWKWNDIAAECERFLAPMGYAGLQVSPITENIKMSARLWYERYQPISYHWDTRSGNEQEFRSMVNRCNKVGVRIYVDVLLNHMSANHPNAIGTGGSTADTFNMHYPAVAYKREHFHSPCKINPTYADPSNYRNCELENLHDLDQSQEHVRTKLVELMNKIIDAGVAGFRIDSARQMWPKDLAVIYSRLHNLNVAHGFAANSKPYIYHEIIDYDKGNIELEYSHLGAMTEFKFGRELSRALLAKKGLSNFRNWHKNWPLDSSHALTFIDNHDSQRQPGDIPLTYKKPKLYKMAIAFMLAHPYGNPQVMSSYDFNNAGQGPPADFRGNIVSPSIKPDGSCGNGWICEHRWPVIYRMVGFRNCVGNAKLSNWHGSKRKNQEAFCRGNRGFFAINGGRVDFKRKLKVCLPPGTYCDIISGELKNGKCTGKVIKIEHNGEAHIEILANDKYGVLAIHANAKAA